MIQLLSLRYGVVTKMAWGKAGSTTKSGAGTGLSISSLTASDTNLVLTHQLSSTNVSPEYRLDSNSNTDYAYRKSNNGGADGTVTSDNNAQIDSNGGNNDKFAIIYFCNLDGEEKLAISSLVDRNTAGAGNAPNRTEGVSKVDTTTNTGQFTAIDVETGGSAIGADSNVSALGSEITPVAAVPALGANIQAGSRYEETDTRKMYNLTDPLVVDDDFTSYTDQTAFDNSWVTSNTAKFRGNPTNDNIDILNSNAYDNIYYDLGSVSDTKWLCKFKVTLTTAGSQALGFCYFYVGSTTGDANESNDGLGFYFYDDANNTYALADNGNRPDQTTVTGALGINPSTTTYYAEMKRTSATSFTVTLYSDSSYSTSLGTSTLTISSGITGLRYFKIMGYTTSGGLVGTFDDFKFYNNSTETSKYWQEIGA